MEVNTIGTNFYHRTNICECCHRYDERHIGKSSGGWAFSFRGYGADYDGVEIKSYKDWLSLLEGGGEIRSEYGELIPLDDFKAMVEGKRAAPLNQATETWQNYPSMADDVWLDEEGNAFCSRYFS